MENPSTTETAGRELAFSPAFSLVPKDLGQAMEYARLIAGTALVPKSYRAADGTVNPGDVLIAVQLGLEVGLKPLQAIQNIAVINGQPTIWGDGAVALVLGSGECEYLKRTWDEKTKTATVVGKRKGKPERTVTFSMQDAERAGLAGKDTYKKFPQRMCGWRAFSYFARDEFADILKGLKTREEVEEYDEIGKTEEGHALLRPKSASGAPTPGASVENFLKESKAAPPANVGNGGARPAPQVDRTKLQKVLVRSTAEKQGRNGGKTFYVIAVETEKNGILEATTFDSGLRDAAQGLVNNFALIATKAIESGGKTYINLTHIEAEAAEAPPEVIEEPGALG